MIFYKNAYSFVMFLYFLESCLSYIKKEINKSWLFGSSFLLLIYSFTCDKETSFFQNVYYSTCICSFQNASTNYILICINFCIIIRRMCQFCNQNNYYFDANSYYLENMQSYSTKIFRSYEIFLMILYSFRIFRMLNSKRIETQ